MKEVFGSDTNTMIDILAGTYGELEDKQALYAFTRRNTFYEAPTEGIEYFHEDFVKRIGLSGDYIGLACFKNIINDEGYFVVNNPELDSEYIFLYKRFPTSLVIHPFEVHEKKWKLITPTKISIEDNSLRVEVLYDFSTTPDGQGRKYHLPNAAELKGYADYNLLLFCFIANQCYAHAEG